MVRKEIFADKKKADAVVKEYLTGSTAKELATAFDCSMPPIYKLLKARKVKTRRGNPSQFTDEDRAKVVEMYKAGSPTRDIAEMADCSAPTINKILVAEGVKIRPRGRRMGSGKKKVKYQEIPSNEQLKKAARGAKVLTGRVIKTKVTYKTKRKAKAKAARKPAPGKPRPARPKRNGRAHRARRARKAWPWPGQEKRLAVRW